MSVITNKIKHIHSSVLLESLPCLRVFDRVLLSGIVYTARDAAHKKIMVLLDQKLSLPIVLAGSIIYYAGPTNAPGNLPIGSCGPTTATRMDSYTPQLLDLGLSAIIGKGGRTQPVVDAIKRNGAVYFCALGGAGALACNCITACDVVAFKELGCESIKKLTLHNFPLLVGIDSRGDNIFVEGPAAYRRMDKQSAEIKA